MDQALRSVRHDGRLLQTAVIVVVACALIVPILAGLWETTRAAFGVLPALGADVPSLAAWRTLAGLPGLGTSLRLTLTTGGISTLASLVLALGLCAALSGRMPHRAAQILTPFLAIPHAALAVGLAFILAPSGWIARMIAPLAGWALPPQIASVNDPLGIALTFGLMLKETPFLLLVILSAQSQIPMRAHLAMGASLGYGRATAWLKLIAPQVWPLIRLPVWVVLSYALSNVDMAIILGPSTPPTLAVAVMRWFTDPALAMILPASAGALLQAILVILCVLTLIGAEHLMRHLGRVWLRRGGRGRALDPALRALALAALGVMILGALAIVSLGLWSISWRWPFPHIVPQSFSLRPWGTAGGWPRALGQTTVIAAASVAASLALAIAWLEAEDRSGRRLPQALLYLPLILPQIGFLYGLNIIFLRADIPAGLGAVIWAQGLFVFPYVMIALTDPWRAVDPNLLRASASLGAGPWRRLIAVKLPILLRPTLAAAAIGVAVSVAQFLPTLFMGAGRITTLTTEAVTLSSASDRRITGVFATLQAALPLIAYLVAFALPRWWHRNRRALTGGLT